MSGWIAWVLVAAALGAGELHTGGFWLAPFAIGAVGGALAGALGAGAAIQFVVFFAATVATFGLVRPIARRHISMPPTLRTGTAALLGGEALVVEEVDRDGGSVRIGGEVWTARAYLEDERFEPGARVHVMEIRGATALVSE
jgi:membrane protein implicated in regulation of membrane protease activity